MIYNFILGMKCTCVLRNVLCAVYDILFIKSFLHKANFILYRLGIKQDYVFLAVVPGSSFGHEYVLHLFQLQRQCVVLT